MRRSNKKLIIAGFVLIGVWFFVLFYPFEVSRSSLVTKMKEKVTRPKIYDLEMKLKYLENELDMQSSEITELLDSLNHIQKTESQPKASIDNRGKESFEEKAMPAPPSVTVLPVLVIACNRVTVKRCLDNLVKFRPSRTTFPIIVSQDCGHEPTYEVIRAFVDKDPSITVVKQPNQSDIILPTNKNKFKGYYKIARHYRFALNHVFRTLGHSAVIIVEDDLDISPDFFEYFEGTHSLLYEDPSIWCISAWNDNGKWNLIDRSHPELLYRTDFFPGLGWTLRKESWLELEPDWPEAFFDDWLRDPKVTKGRSCIRPEVSRTYSFGKLGVSQGLFFEMHLRHLHLNNEFVQFTKGNFTYLHKLNYDEAFTKAVAEAEPMQAAEVMMLPAVRLEAQAEAKAVRVSYMDAPSFQKAAKKLGLMDDFRSNIPRTAYLGIVTCFINGRRVYLAPAYHWTGYTE